ncbi:MAG: hypothetical protein ACYTEL_06260 [Planctomycetota bacterium]|jgi:hypothetical protein
MKAIAGIVSKLLAAVLVVAASLKGWQLLTEQSANNGIYPWMTLFAIDLPAILALSVFRPKGEKLFDRPSIRRFAAVACVAPVALGITMPILALNEAVNASSSYEVLEPETWVGKKLPILEHIDIGESLKKGNWLILLYRHDCPDCTGAIEMYEEMARKWLKRLWETCGQLC